MHQVPSINGSRGQQSLQEDDDYEDSPVSPTLPVGLDTPEWQQMVESVVKCVVSIHFCQTYSFDTDTAISSEATGFVVDAERGLILTNRVCGVQGVVRWMVTDRDSTLWELGLSGVTAFSTIMRRYGQPHEDSDFLSADITSRSAMSTLSTATLSTTLESSASTPKLSST